VSEIVFEILKGGGQPIPANPSAKLINISLVGYRHGSVLHKIEVIDNNQKAIRDKLSTLPQKDHFTRRS